MATKLIRLDDGVLVEVEAEEGLPTRIFSGGWVGKHFDPHPLLFRIGHPAATIGLQEKYLLVTQAQSERFDLLLTYPLLGRPHQADLGGTERACGDHQTVRQQQ